MVYIYYDPNDEPERRFGIFLVNDTHILMIKGSSWHSSPVVLKPFIPDTNATTLSSMERFKLLLTFPTKQAYNE